MAICKRSGHTAVFYGTKLHLFPELPVFPVPTDCIQAEFQDERGSRAFTLEHAPPVDIVRQLLVLFLGEAYAEVYAISSLPDNILPDFGDSLYQHAEYGRGDEGDEGSGEYFDGRCPEAENALCATFKQTAYPCGGTAQDEHVAQIHPVAGLGYGQDDFAVEGTGAGDFPDDQDPCDGH